MLKDGADLQQFWKLLLICQSENISLQSELDSLVSVSMIDDYAVNKLGMKKVKSNQIQYVDVDGYKAQKQAQLGKQANQNAKAKASAKTAGNK